MERSGLFVGSFGSMLTEIWPVIVIVGTCLVYPSFCQEAEGKSSSASVFVTNYLERGSFSTEPRPEQFKDKLSVFATAGEYDTYTPYQKLELDLREAGYDVLVFIASREEDESRITCGNAILSGHEPAQLELEGITP